jgi:dihydropteroate synthase
MRKLFYWKLKAREIKLGERTAILGVLNVTPDSFSDGGKYQDPDRAFARALEMEEQGADIIDIGAESTRPESAPISAAEELRRLIPVLKRLRGQLRIPHFRGYLQSRGGGARPGARRRDHQRPHRPDVRGAAWRG